VEVSIQQVVPVSISPPSTAKAVGAENSSNKNSNGTSLIFPFINPLPSQWLAFFNNAAQI
jgi:hypothetical protein